MHLRVIAIVAAFCSAQVAAQPAAPPPVSIAIAPAAADPGAEIVCRKVKDTGSLIRTKKTCHTKSQWAYIADQNQRFGRQMVEDGTGRPAGN